MFTRIVRGSLLGCLGSLLILSQLFIVFGAIHNGKLNANADQLSTSNSSTLQSTRKIVSTICGTDTKVQSNGGQALEPARPSLIQICLQGLTRIKRKLIKKLPSILKDVLTEVLGIPKKLPKNQRKKDERKSSRFVQSMRENKYKLKEKFAKAFAHRDSPGNEAGSSGATDNISMNTIASSSTKKRRSIKTGSVKSIEKQPIEESTEPVMYSMLVATITKSINYVMGRWQKKTTEDIAEATAELILYRVYLKLSISPKVVVPPAVAVTGVAQGTEAHRIEQLRHAMRTGTAVPMDLSELTNSDTSATSSNANNNNNNNNNNQANSSSNRQPRAPASTITGIRGVVRRVIDAALDKLLNWIYPDVDAIVEGSILRESRATSVQHEVDQAMTDMGAKIANWPSDMVLGWFNTYRRDVLSKEPAASSSSSPREDINSAQICANVEKQMTEISTKLDSQMSSYLEVYTNSIIVDLKRKGRKATRKYLCRKIHKIIPVFSDLIRVDPSAAALP
ncbi:hypothetical protein BDF22DRAFT_739989 [Syncephalis plumigaleata]|nr:hypothetical protein BDF22DRAFT_739989 [Syncephalis plumigaleata]